MTSLQCNNCNKTCVFKARPKEDETFGASCDYCKLIYCKECSSLTTTETHAIALSVRSLLYLCRECKRYLKDLPNVKSIVEQLDKLKRDCKEKDLHLDTIESNSIQRIEELETENFNLTKECADKSAHIKRLNRKTQDFEDSVFESEQRYAADLKAIKDKNLSLEKDMIKLLEKNKELLKNLNDLEDKNNVLKKELQELNILKTSMLVTIETLTAENENYIAQLKEANMKLFESRSHGTIPCEQSKDEPPTICNEKPPTKHPRVLLIGNRACVNGTARLLKQYAGTVFDTNSQYKNRATLEELIDTFLPLARGFTRNDYVLLFTGNVNAIKGHRVKEHHLNLLRKLAAQCNLVIISPPFAADRHIFNSFLYTSNLTIFGALNGGQSEPFFVNMDNFTDIKDKNWFGSPSFSAKKKTMAFISREIMKPSESYPAQTSRNESHHEASDDVRLPRSTNFPNASSR